MHAIDSCMHKTLRENPSICCHGHSKLRFRPYRCRTAQLLLLLLLLFPAKQRPTCII